MLEMVKRTKGFVLQIQQGVVREKTKMQEAEERMGGWLDVPRIGVFAFPVTHVRGGTSLAELRMQEAIAAAQAQWEKGVWKDLQMVSAVFEAVEGELQLNERGEVEGLARTTYPDGATYFGQWRNGNYHGHRTHKYADGSIFVGDYENNRMHGRGTYSYANGDVYVGFYNNNQHNGTGIYMHKVSGSYFLNVDGLNERELSRAEAGQLAFRDLLELIFCARLKRSSKSAACRSCHPETEMIPSLAKRRIPKGFGRSERDASHLSKRERSARHVV